MGYRSSLTVGILGLIPFVTIFVCCLITPADQEVYDLLIYLFVSYAAIISSFLGGIQWGLITASADRIYSVFLPLLISTIPALMGWSALIFVTNLFYSLIIIVISFILALAHDYYLYNTKATPYWFLNIRVPLTSAVIIISILMFFYIN